MAASKWWDESSVAGVESLDWANTGRRMISAINDSMRQLEEAKASVAQRAPDVPSFPSLSTLMTGGSWSEPEDEATADPSGWQSLDALTASWFPKQTQTPSGTPAAMPSNAPRTGGIENSTITNGPRPDQQLRPGESVGSVSFGPPSGPPAEGVLRWSEPVQAASRKYGVPTDVIMGIMEIESGGNPGARSSQGAMGLMQVMPFHYGQGEDGMDPHVSIDRGTKILADNYRRYGDWDRAAAAYFGAIDENGNITDASDATGTVGSKYVQLFRGAASKYGSGARNAGDAATSPAPAPVSAPAVVPPPQPSSATGAPIPYQSQSGQRFRVVDEWGNEYEMTQEDLNTRPGGTRGLRVLGPVAMNAGGPSSSPEPPAAHLPQQAGPAVPPGGAGLHPNVQSRWQQMFGDNPPTPEEMQQLQMIGLA